jgi:hypothetical protein
MSCQYTSITSERINPEQKIFKMNNCDYLKKHSSAIKIQSCWRGVKFRIKKVLEPCNISEIGINEQKLQKCLTDDYLTPGRMEYYKSTSTQNLRLEDGFMEFITAKCIDDGCCVGEGNCQVDVVKGDIGIDVLCVCLNGTQTNEKSIMQNFTSCGNNLDNLFENNPEEALDVFKKEFNKKLLNVKKNKKLSKLYYCAFISTDVNVYMSVFKINLECTSNIKYENITKQKKSIKFKGFIDEKFGVSTLFKSKKRLELRLNKNILDCYNTIKII